MDPIRVGIIGYGLAGSVFHAPLVESVPGFTWMAAVTANRGEEVVRNHPHVRVESDPEALFADPSVDLVVVASPNETHFSLAKRALLAGKHVVVDKPFVIRSEEGDELNRLALDRGRVLSAFHNRRWDNDFLTLRSCMEAGRMGEVHTYHARWDRFRPQVRDRWRERDEPGAGTLYDLGSHLIDQALCLFGMPDTVTADLFPQRWGAQVPDYFYLTLAYGKRRRVVLSGGSMVAEPGPRFEVHGERGSFIKWGLDGQEEDLKKGRRPKDPGWGEEDPHFYATLVVEDGRRISERVPTLRGSYESYYEGVRNAIRGHAPVPVTADEATQVIRVIERAVESAALGRTVDW
ncbi:oxidoreductase [Desmospora profundinema]|uniref:Scyllo-inositol 2-dehydrogenase (NADP+) n=1 Tax=Desmospora profundinema TaxID=1571184 RepID=A0ABU1ISM9_9BACL|nr:oxidoreductase [Desmospora profundinema]MDR6227572.1 scyllo-inositol 2-dehydrogenase (NADP+) [Desmospora profundinema]